jgi:hypothetical protein
MASQSGLRTGEPIRLANCRRRVWDPAVAAAGLTGLTPHDLRYTAASLAIASGASVKQVQRMLGHKDAAMTLNVYASLFEDDLDDVSDRLDAALVQAAAASVRPEPSADVIELPDRPPEHPSHQAKRIGAPSRIRTYDTRFRKLLQP